MDIDALVDLMYTVKDRLPEVYRETMYCLEEIAISDNSRRGAADSQGYAPIRSKMGL